MKKTLKAKDISIIIQRYMITYLTPLQFNITYIILITVALS